MIRDWGPHHGRYILIGRLPVPEGDLIRWAMWIEKFENRIVAQTRVGPLFVSTVFLGLDHNFGGGDAILFETMILDDLEDCYRTRCPTWDQAGQMHAEAVKIAEERWAKAKPLLGSPLTRGRGDD